MSRAAIIALAAFLAPAVAHAQTASRSHGEFGRRTQGDSGVVERDVVDIAPREGVSIDAIDIDNRLGDVRIEGHDGDGVTVMAVKRAADDATLDRLKVSLVPDAGGRVAVRTMLGTGAEARPVAANTIRVDLVLRVPRNAHPRVSVWNGNVLVKGLDRGSDVSVNQGNIEVTHVSGAVSTHALNGDQSFIEVLGDVYAEAVSGAMRMDVVKADHLSARVHDGPISARRVFAHFVELRTTTGDIDFAGVLRPGGTYRIASVRGNVKVALASGVAFRVQAMAAGAIEAPDSLRARRQGKRLLATYGGGQRPAGLVLVSRHGDVRVGLIAEP